MTRRATLGGWIASLLLSASISASITSDGPGLPTSICAGAFYQCDKDASRVWSLFQNANGVAAISGDVLAVGSCSMNGATDGTVNVLLGLSSRSGRTYFDASIGFHRDFVDYRNLPSSQVTRVFPGIYSEQNTTTRLPGYDYVSYTDRTATRYWLRYHLETNSLVMVSYFGFTYTMLCEFPIFDQESIYY